MVGGIGIRLVVSEWTGLGVMLLVTGYNITHSETKRNGMDKQEEQQHSLSSKKKEDLNLLDWRVKHFLSRVFITSTCCVSVVKSSNALS